MGDKHNEKALATFAAMGTRPAQWHITPIEWEEVELMLPTLVRCPDCHGNRWVRHNADGSVIPPPDYKTASWMEQQDYMQQARAEKKGASGFSGNCERCLCKSRRSNDYGRSTGEVWGKALRKVMRAKVLWEKGTRFDSRFQHCGQCQLCSHGIKDAFGYVPVTGTGDDGRIHGMWVGRDCAKRFVTTKLPKKDDAHIIERSA